MLKRGLVKCFQLGSRGHIVQPIVLFHWGIYKMWWFPSTYKWFGADGLYLLFNVLDACKHSTRFGIEMPLRQRKEKQNVATRKADYNNKISSTSGSCTNIGSSQMKALVGFDFTDLTSYKRFVQLCHSPTDPACLAFFRIVFGEMFCFYFMKIGAYLLIWKL